jgi:NTE family protein
MSNTPLTQLVRLHRLYWLKVKGLRNTVARLDIGIVNVHPVRQDNIPWDHDGVINRNSCQTTARARARTGDTSMIFC